MIALGCDHGGYELKQEIIKYLEEKNLYLEAENAYLKNLRAVVQQRKEREQKKK